MRVPLFWAVVLFSAIVIALLSGGASLPTPKLTGHLGAAVRYNTGPNHSILGDTWNTAWTDDEAGHDTLYSIVDDTSGPQNVLSPSGCEKSNTCGRNLAIVSFGRTEPPILQISNVNDMRPFGFITQSPPGKDGEAWKANGLTALNGTLYMSVSRHSYGQYFNDYRQRAKDASILQSLDHGKTWTPMPTGQALPLETPLFAGAKFATPIFIQYGKDGSVPSGVPGEDQADQYLYAVSNDGFWNNGNNLHLGRVRRDKVLHSSDWQFYAGNHSWTTLDQAKPILSNPHRLSQAGIQYLAPFHTYVLLEWYYPELGPACTPGVSKRPPPPKSLWDDPNTTCVKHSRWEFYQAAHPWGPWTLFFQQDFGTDSKGITGGYYNPWIPNKFIPGQTSKDGSLTVWIMATGNFMTYGRSWNETEYSLHLFPFTIRAR